MLERLTFELGAHLALWVEIIRTLCPGAGMLGGMAVILALASVLYRLLKSGA